MTRRINGFEFELSYGRPGTIWTQLQGYGGQYGNECLATINDLTGAEQQERVASTCERMLDNARRELRKGGCVYTYQDHEDHAQRIKRQVPAEIVSVRPIWDRESER